MKPAHYNTPYLALGLAGEAGEYADLVKHEQFHGHPEDNDKAAEELGDALWYLSCAALERGFTLSTIAERNLAKLLVRYPHGFTEKESISGKGGHRELDLGENLT